MRPRLIHEEPIVEDAPEAQPGTPSFESPAPRETSRSVAAERRASQDHERRPQTVARGKSRRKPKVVHWETLLRSRPWPGEPPK